MPMVSLCSLLLPWLAVADPIHEFLRWGETHGVRSRVSLLSDEIKGSHAIAEQNLERSEVTHVVGQH